VEHRDFSYRKKFWRSDWQRAPSQLEFSGHLGFCGEIAGFDGLSWVVLVSFHLNIPLGAWNFFLQEKPGFKSAM
jgi:hypothetical protein